MSNLLTAWTITGAAIGGVGSVVGGIINLQFDSSNRGPSLGGALVCAFLGGCVGLAADTAYQSTKEPSPITAVSCAKDAPKNVNISFSTDKDGKSTCTYTPR